jgi:hypothetical protein
MAFTYVWMEFGVLRDSVHRRPKEGSSNNNSNNNNHNNNNNSQQRPVIIRRLALQAHRTQGERPVINMMRAFPFVLQ